MQAANPQTGALPDLHNPRDTGYASSSWVFVLNEQGDGTTRLIVRGLLDHAPTFASYLIWGVTEPIGFVMMRRQMRGIKQRAEALGRWVEG